MERRLGVQVCHGGDGDTAAGSPAATISLPPSMWQCFDMYLALTDSAPSPTRAALERFRDAHMLTLAAAPPLHRLPPSLVAAAALTCSRRLLNVAPEWPQVLVGTTGHALVPQAGGDGSAAGETTALGAACALVSETLRLPPFVPSAYQEALAEGLNGMLRMEKQQAVTKSSAPIQCAFLTITPCNLQVTPTGAHHDAACLFDPWVAVAQDS